MRRDSMFNKIAVNSNTYHGFSLDEAIEGIAGAGFKYIELTATRGWTEHVRADMSDEEIREIRKKLKDHGLTPIALSGHCNLMSEERLQDFIENIELAGKFGCEFIVSSTGEAHFGINEGSRDDILIENIKKVLKKCEELGIKLVLEVHGEHGTGEALYKIVSRVDSEYLGINYDTANVVFYGNRMPEDDIKTCVEKVMFVHLKDKLGANNEWNFPALGKGYLKLDKFLDYIDKNGYTNPLSIEIEFTSKGPKDIEEVNQAVRDSYEYLKSIGMNI